MPAYKIVKTKNDQGTTTDVKYVCKNCGASYHNRDNMLMHLRHMKH